MLQHRDTVAFEVKSFVQKSMHRLAWWNEKQDFIGRTRQIRIQWTSQSVTRKTMLHPQTFCFFSNWKKHCICSLSFQRFVHLVFIDRVFFQDGWIGKFRKISETFCSVCDILISLMDRFDNTSSLGKSNGFARASSISYFFRTFFFWNLIRSDLVNRWLGSRSFPQVLFKCLGIDVPEFLSSLVETPI